MSVMTGDVVAQVFTTTNPSTGAAADADNLPTGALWVDSVANAAVVTIADAAGTGRYTFSVTMPTLAVGVRVQIIVDATIGGVACAGVVWEDQAAVVSGGTYSYSNTVDDGSGNLLDGVFVELATDSAFVNVISATHTNSLGAFTVYSDIAGTHYLRLTIGGHQTGTETVTLA